MHPKIRIDFLHSNEFKLIKSPKLTYKIENSPFGNVLIAFFQKKICHISFIDDVSEPDLNNVTEDFPGARLTRDPAMTESELFGESGTRTFEVLLIGTRFQLNVWKNLAEIEFGHTISYEELAKRVGNEKGVRAVASAVARNKVGYVVPCHRVVRKDGSFGGYRWGEGRKREMLDFEKRKCPNSD